LNLTGLLFGIWLVCSWNMTGLLFEVWLVWSLECDWIALWIWLVCWFKSDWVGLWYLISYFLEFDWFESLNLCSLLFETCLVLFLTSDRNIFFKVTAGSHGGGEPETIRLILWFWLWPRLYCTVHFKIRMWNIKKTGANFSGATTHAFKGSISRDFRPSVFFH
jgi:hypothetical protein